jgi:hypothetical protein
MMSTPVLKRKRNDVSFHFLLPSSITFYNPTLPFQLATLHRLLTRNHARREDAAAYPSGDVCLEGLP